MRVIYDAFHEIAMLAADRMYNCTFVSATVFHNNYCSDIGRPEIDAHIGAYMRTQLQANYSGELTALKGFERHRTKPTTTTSQIAYHL